MLSSTDSSQEAKTSILLIGQNHSDPFPIETAKNIYDYCIKNEINVIVGFETSDLTNITNNDKFLDLREKFLDPKATKQEKEQYLNELIKIEPLRTFHKSVEIYKTRGMLFDDDAYVRFLATNKVVLDRISKKATYASLENLICVAPPQNCFAIENHDLVEELKKSLRLSGVNRNEKQILETFEKERTEFMRDVIMDKAIELESSGYKKDSLILIVNLGAMHAQRLHAKLDIACQSKPNIKIFHIAILDARNNNNKFEHLEIEESKEIQEFFKKNPLLILRTDSLQTDPAIFDKVIGSCLDHIGVDGSKIRLITSEKSGPLLPPGSTISDGRSVAPSQRGDGTIR